MITLTPFTTMGEIAEILERHKRPDCEVYVRIETIRGKPVAILMRDPLLPAQEAPMLLRRQAE